MFLESRFGEPGAEDLSNLLGVFPQDLNNLLLKFLDLHLLKRLNLSLLRRWGLLRWLWQGLARCGRGALSGLSRDFRGDSLPRR